MRDYRKETENRVDFIRKVLTDSGATGIVYGNSGGKDSALVGMLCKMACDNTVGIIMPCASNRNYGLDKSDAETVAAEYNIKTNIIDLSGLKAQYLELLSEQINVTAAASANIAPRLRMITLYAYAASENRLVAGTGNRSEAYMGYFTKWGDGAHDFNPIADLTVTEIYEYLEYLKAPKCVIVKAPSAGLFDGQTDESEMGITYKSIDEYLLNGKVSAEDKTIIDRFHNASEHKRNLPLTYGGKNENK
ncbi:MAG: NAD(+) synthase [Clostridia bacterium]|nr:NAD(+) synthase [Clostridia bacterium]